MSPDQINTILWRLGKQDEQLARIEEHAEKTNGRVSKVEIWIARAEGARSAMGWVQPLVIAVIAAGGAELLNKLLG